MCPQKSNKHRQCSNKTQIKGANQLPSNQELKDDLVKIVPKSLRGKIEEDWMGKLWDKIQEANANKEDKGKAPLAELDLGKPQPNLEIQSRYNTVEPFDKSSNKASTLKKLPSFLGNDVDSVDDIRKIPSQYKLGTLALDIAPLQVLLSAQVKVMMTLAKVLKKILEL